MTSKRGTGARPHQPGMSIGTGAWFSTSAPRDGPPTFASEMVSTTQRPPTKTSTRFIRDGACRVADLPARGEKSYITVTAAVARSRFS